MHQEWLEKLTLAKTGACLKQERANSKSMLLQIEFAQTMIGENECDILYFEPNCEDVSNNAVGQNDLIVDDPELDLVTNSSNVRNDGKAFLSFRSRKISWKVNI